MAAVSADVNRPPPCVNFATLFAGESIGSKRSGWERLVLWQ
jgi:hypothetical protein